MHLLAFYGVNMELTQYHHLWLFFVLCFGIIVLPGMDMAFVMASSLKSGLRHGFAAVLGIIFGGIAHVVMSVFGISLLIKTMPHLFQFLLIAGALYSAYIGWQIYQGASAFEVQNTDETYSLWQSFSRAAITPLLNPKAYLFMVAIFPQYFRPEYGALLPQAIILNIIIAGTQLLIYGAVALGANQLRVWLVENHGFQVKIMKTIGISLILTAIVTLFTV
jgi:threonine/homoserine/homoserine lactone efflux protein